MIDRYFWTKRLFYSNFIATFASTCKEFKRFVRGYKRETLTAFCRDLNLSQSELVDFFVNKAHLALNEGTMYGNSGEGFMRMNVGVSRVIIEQAMENLKKAIR